MLEVTAADASRRPSIPLGIAIGLFAGGLSGLFGVGGGILIVPALAIFGRMQQRLAHGTSLAATAPLALAGFIGYGVAGEVDWVVAALLLAGSVVGAIVGTSLLGNIPQKWLLYGFVLLLLLTAARMMWDTPEGLGRESVDLATAFGLGGVGLFSGSIAGLMGVGGGIIMVPAQIILFSIPTVLAKGTSLAVIIPTAIVGTMRNLRNDNTDLRTAGVIAGAGVGASYLASLVALGLDPTTSAVLFAGLLVAAAFRLLQQRSGATPREDVRDSTPHKIDGVEHHDPR